MPPTSGNPLTMTQSAVNHLLQREGGVVRFYVTAGGHSGMVYHFQGAEGSSPGDTTCRFGDLILIVDRHALPYVTGAQIDYVGGIVVNNPNCC